MDSSARRAIAIGYGVGTHLVFVAAIVAMVINLHQGLQWGRGPFHGIAAVVTNILVILQFPILHSILLGRRGRRVLGRLLPMGLGPDLVATSFALVGSLQLLVTFVLWSPSGIVWWQPSGPALWIHEALWVGSWLFLGVALRDSGLALQTGSLGWTAAARGQRPVYRPFQEQGLFRIVRQPVYLGFALTLWTGPTWTPDHLALALAWTLYCVVGPRLKERRYARRHGTDFAEYRRRVPYMIPRFRRNHAPVVAQEPSRPHRGTPGVVIRTLRFALVFLALSPIAWAQTPPDPDAALRALELERYRGKVVLVDFWASWCGPCAASFPWMSQMVDTHGDRGFVVIVVNLDEERAAAEAFLTDFEDRFVHVFDDTGAIATALSVDAMPTSILFDREGQPAFRHAGFFPEQQPKYEAHIVSLLKGEATGDPALLAGGTTLRGVRPWQRGRLADPDMLLGGNRLDLAFDDHIYFSKEGSSGGRGFGGGGCGCN